MLKSSDLERQLREWRAARAGRQETRPVANGRRRVRVNGREVLIIRRQKRGQA